MGAIPELVSAELAGAGGVGLGSQPQRLSDGAAGLCGYGRFPPEFHRPTPAPAAHPRNAHAMLYVFYAG